MFLTSLPFLTLCIGLAIAFRRLSRLLVTVSVDERSPEQLSAPREVRRERPARDRRTNVLERAPGSVTDSP